MALLKISNDLNNYEFNGNITYIKQNDSLPSMPNLVTRTDNYSYIDGKDWIDYIDEGGTVYTYTYDSNGNITSDDRHT